MPYLRNHDAERKSSPRRRRQAAFPLLSALFLCRSLVLVRAVGGGDGRSGRGPPPPPPPPRPSGQTLDDDDDDWQWQERQGQYHQSAPEGKEDGYAEVSSPWYPEGLESQYPGGYAHGADQHPQGGAWYDDGQSNMHNDDDRANFATSLPTYGDSSRQYGPGDRSDRTRSPPPRPPPAGPYGPETASSRPPPPPPPGSGLSQIPIHYEFPASTGGANQDGAERDAAPEEGDGRWSGKKADEPDDSASGAAPFAATASARRDLVTRYWSTRTGKAQIMASASLLGAVMGNFLSKSLIPIGGTTTWGSIFALLFWASTLFRTPMGELTRALGLSMMLVLQRSWRIRRDYPTWKYIPAAVGLRSSRRGLRPFPPARNPWRYSPLSPRDPDFSMMYAIVSMAFVGSACGGSLPVIPTWMGALAGAGMFALACTWQSPRGDLARTCGMRVVKAVGELWEIQADLQIIPKATVVSSQIIDKAMILDRKHRVKDRFLLLASKGYEQATRVAAQIQQQQRGGVNNDGDNNEDDRRGESRGRGDRVNDSPSGRGLGRRRDSDDARPPDSVDGYSSTSRSRDLREGDDDQRFSSRDGDFSKRRRDRPPQGHREYDEDTNGRGRRDHDDDARGSRKDTRDEVVDKIPRKGRFWR